MFIMSVSTAMLLANYPDSTIRLTLLNNSHNFALLVREAQIRGSAVDSATTTIGGYGILVDKATSSQAILFSDSVDNIANDIRKNSAGLAIGDGVFDKVYSPDDTQKDILTFKDKYIFKKLCVASTTALEYIATPSPFLCASVNTIPINTITISFTRPSQIAHIYVNNLKDNDYLGACIELYSPQSPKPGHVRSVQVLHSGVITTTTKPCN